MIMPLVPIFQNKKRNKTTETPKYFKKTRQFEQLLPQTKTNTKRNKKKAQKECQKHNAAKKIERKKKEKIIIYMY